MDIYTKTSKKSAYKVFLRNDINEDKVALNLVETLLIDQGYNNTQYAVIKSTNAVRLEVEDDNSKKLDALVNQLWEKKLLASNDEETLSWF